MLIFDANELLFKYVTSRKDYVIDCIEYEKASIMITALVSNVSRGVGHLIFLFSESWTFIKSNI